MSKNEEVVISVYSRAARIWNWLIGKYPDCPSIMPPPVHKVVHARDEKKHKDSFTVAEIQTSWFEDDELLEIRDYGMKIYPEVFLDYIKEVFGDHPTAIAVLMIFDHTIMHEYFHYIRNYQAWLPGHEDNDIPYEVCKRNLKKYVMRMGQGKDEEETERLALKYIGEMYGINTALCPVFTGPYAKFMSRNDPTYRDRLCVWNMLQMEFEADICEDDKKRDKIIKHWMRCVLEQTESGRKVPIKVSYK